MQDSFDGWPPVAAVLALSWPADTHSSVLWGVVPITTLVLGKGAALLCAAGQTQHMAFSSKQLLLAIAT